MSDQRLLLKKINFVIPILLLVQISLTQEPRFEKVWTFKGHDGALNISVESFPKQGGGSLRSLEMYSDTPGRWTVAEEAASIDAVLDDLSKQGTDLRSLTAIHLRLSEIDARMRLAEYAAKSDIWRSEYQSAVKSRNLPRFFYPVVTSSLNASGAYREWDDVFGKRNLAIKVVGVEKVFFEPFRESGAQCPAGLKCDRLRVPHDAMVQINIEPLKPTVGAP
jgi:hypothetical protein